MYSLIMFIVSKREIITWIYLFVYLITVLDINVFAALTIDSLIDNRFYDKRIRPHRFSDPVNITLNLYVIKLGPINQNEMTFGISFYFHSRWNDPRLSRKGTVMSSTVNLHPSSMIWTPNVRVQNAINFTEVKGHSRTTISTNGHIFASSKYTARCMCQMELHRFPMDTQYCPIKFISYSLNNSDVNLRWWQGKGFSISRMRSMTGYKLKNTSSEKTKAFFPHLNQGETYDLLIIYFEVERSFRHYLFKAYIPTVMLVLFNLMSYWIPDTAVSARISLIITTFLSCVLIFMSVTDDIVKVSYLTAMQVFMLGSLMFIMIAIVQFLLLIHLRTRKSQLRIKIKNQSNSSISRTPLNKAPHKDENDLKLKNAINDEVVIERTIRTKNMKNSRRLSTNQGDGVHELDEKFKVLMPILYALFCIVYFVYYFKLYS